VVSEFGFDPGMKVEVFYLRCQFLMARIMIIGSYYGGYS